jgi:hypothetical protein
MSKKLVILLLQSSPNLRSYDQSGFMDSLIHRQKYWYGFQIASDLQIEIENNCLPLFENEPNKVGKGVVTL